MANTKKTILKEISAKTDTGVLDTPVLAGASFENVVDTRLKYDKIYSLDQFFDHYMNFMKKADFIYYGNTEPVNHHSRIWIDTAEASEGEVFTQPEHTPQKVYYTIEGNGDGSYSLVLSSTNPIEAAVAIEEDNTRGPIAFGEVAVEYTVTQSQPWQGYIDKINKVIIAEPIYPERSIKYWFEKMENASFINLKALNTSNVTAMAYCFDSCKHLDLSQLKTWNVNKAINFAGCFQKSSITNLNGLERWTFKPYQPNQTAEINMSHMFDGCTALNDVSGIKDWNMANVRNMSYMFQNTTSIHTFESLNNWDVKNADIHIDCFKNNTGIRPSWGATW